MFIIFITATSLQKEWVASIYISAIPMASTDRTIPTTFTVAPTTTSETISTDEAGKMPTWSNLSPIPSTQSIFIQIYLSTKSFSNDRETSIAGSVNILDYAILISVTGAVLTVLLLVAAILYRCVCWNKYTGR